VEGGVEDGHLGQVGEQLAGGRHALQVGRVVQRGQGCGGLDGRHHLIVDPCGPGEALAAVDDAVAHGDGAVALEAVEDRL
jgi:hypothetical protein